MLEALLREHLPGVEAWAYGSRVNGRSHDGSDLDLALREPELKEIPAIDLADFEEAVRESSIPFLVEARDWARLPERFHREIQRDHVVLVAIGDQKTANRNCGIMHTKLGNCAHLVRNSVQPCDVPPDFSYIGLEHIGEDSLHLVGQGTANEVGSTKSRFQAGDTLFGRLRPYFRKVARAPFDGICSTDIWVVRSRNGVDQGFVHYCLASQHFVDFVNSRSEGTRMPRADWKCASEYGIKLPPLSEQRAIAHVLGTLDDKIELNRRMNETLEAMARVLFKDWFVDFGPVRAKMEGRDPYLPAEIWELFSDSFVDSELGEIPEGWVQGTLSDIAESPRRIISPDDVSQDISYIGLEHMPRRSIALSEWANAGKVKSNKTQFNRGEILFGKLRPYFHKVGLAPLDGICSTDIVVVVPQTQEWQAFTLACLSSDEFVDYTDRTSTGTKMPRTSWKIMAQFKICLPSKRAVCAFQGTVQPLLDRLGTNIHETFALARTRDLLLPKLISGQIRLRDAENAIEAAA